MIFACMAGNAQTIVKGDMNDDGVVDVSDVTLVVSTILGNMSIQYINAGDFVDPYAVDNSAVVGTWWKTKNESVTFCQDGTTDMEGVDAYAYQPFLGRIVFYMEGLPVTIWNTVSLSEDAIYVNVDNTSVVVYTKAVPVQLVTDITLSATSIALVPDEVYRLTATVSPSDADNPSVVWSSSNEDVAEVNQQGRVITNSYGTAVITCAATDGSGITATCRINVVSDYVDLGLPSSTLWATRNIGAANPEDYGDYFAWGETEPQEDNNYSWVSYKYAIDYFTNLTKYCNDSSNGSNGFTDELTELELFDDAAYMNWGIDWRMPSKEQFDELINSENTTTEWTTQNGVNGKKITSKSNGNSIFLPAAGYRLDWELIDAGSGSEVYCWTRTLFNADPKGAWSAFTANSRCRGLSVRPVRISE
ncbi:MAG: Ig-like domain-containing protein [Bacteroidaceae bacterium]|nr:Ig-like domain-containing protein [Bacteroidaceae bacterium]